MPIKFEPVYTITPKIMNCLIRIEASKEKILHLPLTPTILNSLRETARLYTTHYSTMIEGNRLDPDQIETVLKHEGHFPGRERDEHEVKGYYIALNQVEKWAAAGIRITEKNIQTLHALVMANGKLKIKSTEAVAQLPAPEKLMILAPIVRASLLTCAVLTNAHPVGWVRRNGDKGHQKGSFAGTGSCATASIRYRDGQNVIRDSRTKAIVYMPPEAKDVKDLMAAMIAWINQHKDLPCPIIAGLAHYQFATIHPYYDGNGRTARLLTTLILHLGGYDLKGLYSLEEYYARNLSDYYNAISVGESHNYYMGRAQSDITKWLEYFIEGMSISFENVLHHMTESDRQGFPDQSALLKKLDPRQRKVLPLFQEFETITSRQISELFGFKPRTSAALCAEWVEQGFLSVIDSSNKGRKYKLAKKYDNLIKKNLLNAI